MTSSLPTRRRLGLAGLSALALPRFAMAQADRRPAITVAVQSISTSNTLEPLIDLDWVGGSLPAAGAGRILAARG